MKYLDTNILIYAIENHPKYGKACKRILSDVESGKIKVCASFLVLVEFLNVLVKINKVLKRRRERLLDLRKNVDAVLSLPIIWYDLNFFLIKHASEYDYDVSGVDYVHIATMELNMVHEVLSADKELDKIPFIKRINPLEY
jgi:predicted nucleic acid-binding protein